MSIQDEILADHQRTWRSFTRFTAVGVLVVAIIVAVVVFLLTH